MKLTRNTIRLVNQLRAVETTEHSSLLNGEFINNRHGLRKNLLALYRRTDKKESRDLIIEIMAEGGYPWFARLAKGAGKVIQETSSAKQDDSFSYLMSEDEFMDLVPVNGHFH